jgi:adenosylmethionine-8-amino-7-oxononanoate aminotransferase
VALSDEVLAREPAAAAKLAGGAREAGVLIRPLLGAAAVSPPLVIEQEHIEEIAAAFRVALDKLA